MMIRLSLPTRWSMMCFNCPRITTTFPLASSSPSTTPAGTSGSGTTPLGFVGSPRGRFSNSLTVFSNRLSVLGFSICSDMDGFSTAPLTGSFGCPTLGTMAPSFGVATDILERYLASTVNIVTTAFVPFFDSTTNTSALSSRYLINRNRLSLLERRTSDGLVMISSEIVRILSAGKSSGFSAICFNTRRDIETLSVI